MSLLEFVSGGLARHVLAWVEVVVVVVIVLISFL